MCIGSFNGFVSTWEMFPNRMETGFSSLSSHVSTTGNYTLYHENTPIKGMAFNYDRSELEMSFYTVEELTDKLADVGLSSIQVVEIAGKPFVQTLSEISQGIRVWRWFVLLALAFLLTEVLLLRFWS